MNRDVKFRAWDKRKNKMYQVVDLTFSAVYYPDSPISLVLSDGKVNILDGVATTKNCELMQYTELKDKNGKEIYEGDIIGQKNNEGGYWWKSKVFFDKGAFMLNEDQTLEFVLDDFEYDLEVIGNIYENPELLP